jgi:transposase
MLEQVAAAHHRLALVWADGGYTGSLIEHGLAAFALVLAIVKRSDNMKGFVVLPKRWIVERLFAHLMRSSRLARDFERRIASAEGEPAGCGLGQPASGDQAFRLRPQCLHPRRHHVHAEHCGHFLAGQRPLAETDTVRDA